MRSSSLKVRLEKLEGSELRSDSEEPSEEELDAVISSSYWRQFGFEGKRCDATREKKEAKQRRARKNSQSAESSLGTVFELELSDEGGVIRVEGAGGEGGDGNSSTRFIEAAKERISCKIPLRRLRKVGYVPADVGEHPLLDLVLQERQIRRVQLDFSIPLPSTLDGFSNKDLSGDGAYFSSVSDRNIMLVGRRLFEKEENGKVACQLESKERRGLSGVNNNNGKVWTSRCL